ncbi:MAG: hypothetical protein HGA47_05005 [Zoogloea sp.]|nr:hypothetical protein [Zoogloea sp.]
MRDRVYIRSMGGMPSPTLRPSLCHPSGGLGYHLRALRHRALWAPFRDTVAGWLDDWRPGCERLVLIGPSAGHTLPEAFLSTFGRVTALEPDPLARWLLRRRFAAVSLDFDPLDCLAGADGLALLAARFPDAAFLFCNVLGQIPAPGGRRWSGLLTAHLAGRHWASWHDAVSTTLAPRTAEPRRVEQPAKLEDVLARFWSGGELPLTDHETFGLGGAGVHDYAIWRLQPTAYHLVEWCRHRPAALPDTEIIE